MTERPPEKPEDQKPDDEDNKDLELGRMAAEIEAAAADHRRYHAIDYHQPYPKQLDFIGTGIGHRERAAFFGTQTGKTETLCYETAVHLTGLYPPNWPGRKWDRPVNGWCVGESLKMTRDVLQKRLCGEPGSVEAFGSGFIPKHLFVGDPVLARGETGSFDSVQVRHVSGGISTLKFRTYQAGRQALQGATLDFVQCDEEPAFDIYTELMARVSATRGFISLGATPLLDESTVVLRFRNEPSPDRTYVEMGLGDIPDDGHIPLSERESLIASYPEYEREARITGRPTLGSGRVYTTPESEITTGMGPMDLVNNAHWRWGGAMDIGIDHPWSYCLMCHDIDQDVLYVVAELRMKGQTPGQHFALIRALELRIFGRHMDFPTAWPADAGTRDKGSGEPIKNLYKQFGIRMMASHATHAKAHAGVAANSLEAGVYEINLREQHGKWKVFRSCVNYLEERRSYHRKDGEIARVRDDVLAAARYGMMMRQHFKQLNECDPMSGPGGAWPGGGGGRRGGGPQFAEGMDIDPITGDPI